jgi:hypothetical protein
MNNIIIIIMSTPRVIPMPLDDSCLTTSQFINQAKRANEISTLPKTMGEKLGAGVRAAIDGSFVDVAERALRDVAKAIQSPEGLASDVFRELSGTLGWKHDVQRFGRGLSARGYGACGHGGGCGQGLRQVVRDREGCCEGEAEGLRQSYGARIACVRMADGHARRVIYSQMDRCIRTILTRLRRALRHSVLYRHLCHLHKYPKDPIEPS